MNSSKEFLEELAEELRYLPAKQVNEVLKHYRDKINVETDYGTPIEKVLESMKTPTEIAKDIYQMHGVNYLAKRKKHTKRKDVFNAFISLLIMALCLILYFGISYFFETVMINQFALIVNAFGFGNVLDSILTTLCIFSYILVMIIVLIFITDLFIILLNGLLGKVLDAKKSTRGKNYEFMDFTFTGWFNEKTKKPKFLFKLLIGCVIAFFITGISSYATNGYINRTIKNVPSKTEVLELKEDFNKIYINSNEVDFNILEDENILCPTISYEYEFNHYAYNITNHTLNITVEKNKTYDFLGIIQAPSAKLTLHLPLGYKIDNILVEINYGDVYLKKLSNTDSFTITLLNGNVMMGENQNINSGSINLTTGNLISNKNIFDVLKITQGTGELNSGEDVINKLTHINGSSKVTTVGSVIKDYNLNNSSGEIYLENISGDSITINTNASINTLFDINYRIADFKMNNASKFNITRSYFSEKLITLSNSKTYQTLEYVKAPFMEIKGLDGTIICTNINTNYISTDINKFEDEYRDRVYAYNNILLANREVKIISYDADISLDTLECETLYFEQTRHLSDIDNVLSKNTQMIFLSALSNISEFYGDVVEMKIDSRSITDKASIDFNNSKESELTLNVEKDGTSDFVYSKNIKVNFK